MYILRESSRDWLFVGIVALLALGTNLPEEWTQAFSVDRRYLLVGLMAIVGVSLVRYLKFSLILVVALLSMGANMPQDLAAKFGIDTNILLLALVAMIVMSLSNRLLKLPTGLEKQQGAKSTHGAAALFNAIVNGRLATVEALIAAGANVNVRTVNGTTPLMVASSKGYSDIVKVLLDHGSDPSARKSDGVSALAIAEHGGFSRTADVLRRSISLQGNKANAGGAAGYQAQPIAG
ncbi:MAG: ankyrin repeat domain-containing protein [Acidiferrobacterales bacterium]